MALYSNNYPFVQEPLPYSYDALEPLISARLLEHHYNNIFSTYFVELNRILSAVPEYQNKTIVELLMDAYTLPNEIQFGVLLNAGGIYNHSVYFEGMIPQRGELSGDVLKDEINEAFSSFDNMKNIFIQTAQNLYGSGYVALVRTRRNGLRIISLSNNDTAVRVNLLPIIQIDLYEHAYELGNNMTRSEYTEKWFDLVNWNIAEQRYTSNFNFRTSTQ